MLDFCTTCIKRTYCTSLCPEAEMYAGQDWVYLQELPIGDASYTNEDIVEKLQSTITSKFRQWPRKKQVLTLLEKEVSRKVICQVLNITRENLRYIINKLNKDLTKSPKDTK